MFVWASRGDPHLPDPNILMATQRLTGCFCFAIITCEEAEATGELHDGRLQRPFQKSQWQGRPGGHLLVPVGSKIERWEDYDDFRGSFRIDVGYWSQKSEIHRIQVGGQYCDDFVCPKNLASRRQKHQQQHTHTFLDRRFDSGRIFFLLLC